MELIKVRQSKFSVVGEATYYTDHSLAGVESIVTVAFDTDNMINFAELNSYEKLKQSMTHTMKALVKEICGKTNPTNYATFTLNDDEGFPLYGYSAMPFFNEMQFGKWLEEKDDFDWCERFEVANSHEQHVIVEEIAVQIANGIFELMESEYFEFE